MFLGPPKATAPSLLQDSLPLGRFQSQGIFMSIGVAGFLGEPHTHCPVLALSCVGAVGRDVL